jgi:hypothetical protein
MQEIFEEAVEDTKQQGSLQLVQAQTSQFIIQATGMTPDGQPLVLPGMDQVDENGNPVGMAPAVDPMLAQEIIAGAYDMYPAARDDFEE